MLYTIYKEYIIIRNTIYIFYPNILGILYTLFNIKSDLGVTIIFFDDDQVRPSSQIIPIFVHKLAARVFSYVE